MRMISAPLPKRNVPEKYLVRKPTGEILLAPGEYLCGLDYAELSGVPEEHERSDLYRSFLVCRVDDKPYTFSILYGPISGVREEGNYPLTPARLETVMCERWVEDVK